MINKQKGLIGLHYSIAGECFMEIKRDSYPVRIADILRSKQTAAVSSNTIRAYICYLEDAFLFTESKRYDIKGKSYFDSPSILL